MSVLHFCTFIKAHVSFRYQNPYPVDKFMLLYWFYLISTKTNKWSQLMSLTCLKVSLWPRVVSAKDC